MSVVNNLNDYETNFHISSTDEGYVYVRNMGGFSAMFSLKYIYNEKEYNLNTGIITLFFSSTLKIPATATDIFIVVYISNALGEWVPIYNNNLEKVGVVSLELYGTIWSPQYTITKDTQPTSKSVTVYNEGAYNARLTVEYYINEKSYKLNSGIFSLGMWRNIAIPDIVLNQSVIIEIDATGIGNWMTIYNDNFSQPTNLEITLSGTISNPQVDINSIGTTTVPEVNPTTMPSPVSGVEVSPINTVTAPCNIANNILDQYMKFMQQAHTDFLNVLNKVMNN